MIDINKPLYLAYEWDLTDEEIKRLEATECGGSVELDTSPFPVVFPDDKDKTWFLIAFDSIEKASDDFLQKYAIQEHSVDFVLVIMKAFYKLRHKNIVLAVNLYDKKRECITMEELITNS